MKINVARTIGSKTGSSINADKIISLLLKDRKYKDIDSFLNPQHPIDITFQHFFSDEKKFIKDWKKTVDLLQKIRDKKKMIIVYMDYDADGITGGAILWQTLNRLGFEVMPHVPDRKKEGYGFSKKGIDDVKERYDPALIISVDHGIVAHEQIEYAHSLGIDVIVTDHHQKKDTLPGKAYAIFHTDRVSGSGVAYFFAKEILQSFSEKGTEEKQSSAQRELLERFSSDFLALASIGVIADLVPLVEEARSVAFHGLKVLSKPLSFARYNPGLLSLLQESGLYNKLISTYEVGFIIAPRINAFGRIRSAMDALRLLCTNDLMKAKSLAIEAGATNKERQDLVEKAVVEAQKLVDTSKKILIVTSDKWEEGIIGLIAGKLTQEYYKPSIVLTRSNGFAKASVRSISELDVTKFLRDLEDYFIDLGGHAAAAGFTIENEKVDTFIQAAHKKADKEITNKMLERIAKVDMEIPLKIVTTELAQKLQTLEPFGVGNRTPLFKISAHVQDVEFMGKMKQHVKFLLKGTSEVAVEAVFFNGAEVAKKIKGKNISFLSNIYIDVWNGRQTLKLRVVDILPS